MIADARPAAAGSASSSECAQRGGVRVSDLVELLGVSDMTVRRDLDVLAARGLLDKVHGGATAGAERSTDEPGFEAKSCRERAEKDAIARRAAELVEPGHGDRRSRAGTTTWRAGRATCASVPGPHRRHQLDPGRRRASTAAGGTDQTVVLTGGLRTPSDALVGPVAVAALRSCTSTCSSWACTAWTHAAGFTTPEPAGGRDQPGVVAAARRLVVVADHTKWGVVGLRTIADLHGRRRPHHRRRAAGGGARDARRAGRRA